MLQVFFIHCHVYLVTVWNRTWSGRVLPEVRCLVDAFCTDIVLHDNGQAMLASYISWRLWKQLWGLFPVVCQTRWEGLSLKVRSVNSGSGYMMAVVLLVCSISKVQFPFLLYLFGIRIARHLLVLNPHKPTSNFSSRVMRASNCSLAFGCCFANQ